MFSLNLNLISQAASFLSGQVRRTPLELSPYLSDLMGSPVYLKLEMQQITGSFKVRGALFYLSTLKEEERRLGVATCSAGNHGLGVAYAAGQIKVPCTVYVPSTVDEAKEAKIMKLGARVIRSQFEGYDETALWAQTEVSRTGAHFISPFEDPRIMAANGGTIATEILEDMPGVQNVLFPVGGGGIGAGLAFYFKSKVPHTRLIGCQHLYSPALKLSLEKQEAVTALPPLNTIAGGIEGGIGRECFEVLKSRIDDVMLLKEEDIEEAVRWLLKFHQYLVEPSSSVAVAPFLKGEMSQFSGKTVVVLTGRNVAYSTLKELLKA